MFNVLIVTVRCVASIRFPTGSAYLWLTVQASHAVVKIRVVCLKPNFAQVGIGCTYGQLYVYVPESPDEFQTPAHWNLSRGSTPLLSHCAMSEMANLDTT